jgi:octopine/nopaline transport system permease protein
MLESVIDILPRLLDGLSKTLILLVVSSILSFPFAVLMALAYLSSNRIASGIAKSYLMIFRGTPALVQLYFIYYGFSMSAWMRDSWAWVLFESAWFCGVFALTLNTAAYQTEIFRGALQAVPTGLVDAARSLGLSRLQLFFLIRFPAAFRLALPAYGNELILLAKATSIVSTITILDLMGTAKLIYTETFDPFAPLLTAGALYLLLVWGMQLAMSGIEHYFMPHMRHDLRQPRGSQMVKLRRQTR